MRGPARDDAPVVRPANPSTPPTRAVPRLIPIPPGRSPGVQQKAVDRFEYWKDYFRHHGDEKNAIPHLREDLTLLHANKKFGDVRAALTAFMMMHPKSVEPWMYNALALAIREEKGPESDFRLAMKYAADTAERSRNPNHLVNAADLLFLNGDYERAGRLVDQAAELVPHQAIPSIMSINVAEKTKDPRRMASAIERLLSLSWPGDDERIRRDAKQMAEKLATTLREEGRDAEADELLAKLPEYEARDLFVRLTWTGRAGLDLSVEDPLGVVTSLKLPRSVAGGSLVKNSHGPKDPEDVYTCPRGFDGTYTIRVDTFFNDPEKPATTATLEIITHEGTPQEHKEVKTLVLGDKPPAPVAVTLKGGRRKTAMPFLAPPKPVASPAPVKPKAEKPAAGKR